MQRIHHRGVRDLDDPVRGVDDAQAEGLRAPLLNCTPGTLDVEVDLAAEEVRGVEAAEDDVRVGNGGLDTAAAVTDSARVGACALRTDPQQPAGVHPRDRTATG